MQETRSEGWIDGERVRRSEGWTDNEQRDRSEGWTDRGDDRHLEEEK
jgi:hypothetical protein